MLSSFTSGDGAELCQRMTSRQGTLQLPLHPADPQLPRGLGNGVLQGPVLSPEPTTHAGIQSSPSTDF